MANPNQWQALWDGVWLPAIKINGMVIIHLDGNGGASICCAEAWVTTRKA